MSGVVVFEEFDPYESFAACVKHVNDGEYCKKAVELMAEAQVGREYTYGGRARLHAAIPPYVIYRRLAMAADKERRAVVLFLDGRTFTLVLLYERRNGDFELKFADWITSEIKALMNPHSSAFRNLRHAD
jgi:hypothetical protein